MLPLVPRLAFIRAQRSAVGVGMNAILDALSRLPEFSKRYVRPDCEPNFLELPATRNADDISARYQDL